MADDPTLAGLAADLTNVRKALDAMGKGAKDAGDETKKTGEKAASAGKVIAEKFGEGARAATGFEKATKDAGAGALTLGNALSELARDGIASAVAGLEEFARNVPEAAARSEAHAETLARLGASYAAVQQATNGAVSAEQAAGVQQRALQAGLRLSAQELAAVTARAREFARATGGDVNQALDQLTDQLIQPGEELAKFGVRLRTGMAAGDGMREALRQLTAQASATGASQLSLAESMEMTTRAQREATDALSGMIARRLELRDFFTQMASWLDDAKDATNGWEVALDGVVGTLREAIGLRPQVGAAQNQSASGAFIETAGEQAAMLRRRGVNMQGVDLGQFATQATPQQRAEMLGLFTQLTRATEPQGTSVAGTRGVGGAPVQGYADPSASAATPAAVAARLTLAARMRTLAEVAARGAEEVRRDEAAQAAAAARARRDEIQRRNRAGQSASTASTPTMPEGFGIGTAGFLTDYARNAFALARQAFNAARSAPSQREYFVRPQTIAERVGALGAQRESADARIGLEAAQAPTGGAPFSDRARASAGAESRLRQERIRILQEQSAAMRELITAAEREQDLAMRQGRPIAEVNELVRQRIGLQTALAANTRDLTVAQQESAISFAEIGDKIVGVLDQTVDAFGEGVVAAIEGSADFVKSVEAMVYGTLRALTKMAVVEVIKETAMGIGALATYRYDAAAQHFAAAGVWAGVGVAAGVGLAAMPNPNAAKSAGGSGGGTATRSADTGRSARVDEKAAGGPLNLVINVSGAAFTDAGVQQAVSASLRDAVGNGYLTRTQLAGLLGGD